MNPGIELDKLVAEKVMGAIIKESAFGGEPHCDYPNRKTGHAFGKLPPFSTSMSADWEIVEKLSAEMEFELGTAIIDISEEDRSKDKRGWMCGFCFREFQGYSETVPHAICLAALKAVGAL